MSIFEIGAFTIEEALKGGQYDDGQPAPMEEDDEEEEEEQEEEKEQDDEDLGAVSWVLREYPPPTPTIELKDASGAYFRFPEKLIPKNLASIPPQVMLGLRGWQELEEKEKRNVFGHVCMPMIVHGSPLVSLIMNKYVEVKGKKKVAAQEKPFSRRYQSWAHSVFLLDQLRFACMNGMFPFHNSVTKTYLDKCAADFDVQLKQISDKLPFDLGFLFEKAKMVGWKSVRQEFIDLLENYSMQHIWNIEFYLYSLLVLPYGDTITLSQVLTPNERPSLANIIEGKRQNFLKDVHDYLAFRTFLRAEQILECNKKGIENPDKSPNSLVPDRFKYDLDHSLPQDIYRGYLPEKVLKEFFTSLDTKNILGLAK